MPHPPTTYLPSLPVYCQASKRNAEMDGAPHVLQCDTGDASVIARLVLEAVEQRGLF